MGHTQARVEKIVFRTVVEPIYIGGFTLKVSVSVHNTPFTDDFYTLATGYLGPMEAKREGELSISAGRNGPSKQNER